MSYYLFKIRFPFLHLAKLKIILPKHNRFQPKCVLIFPKGFFFFSILRGFYCNIGNYILSVQQTKTIYSGYREMLNVLFAYHMITVGALAPFERIFRLKGKGIIIDEYREPGILFLYLGYKRVVMLSSTSYMRFYKIPKPLNYKTLDRFGIWEFGKVEKTTFILRARSLFHIANFGYFVTRLKKNARLYGNWTLFLGS